jgi:hypothetical protein
MNTTTDARCNKFIGKKMFPAEAQTRQKECHSVLVMEELAPLFCTGRKSEPYGISAAEKCSVQWKGASVLWKASQVQWKNYLRAVESLFSQQWKVCFHNKFADKIVSSGQGVFGGGLYIGSEW